MGISLRALCSSTVSVADLKQFVKDFSL